MSEAPSDAELVARAREGDRRAFGMLVERYQRRAYAVALGMLHDPDDARDVVQDAFVRVHRNLGRFHGRSGFYTWLYRIVANLCVDHRRRRRRRPEVALEEGIEHDDVVRTGVDVAPHRDDADPARNLTRAELRRELRRALLSLSEKHRIILLLREVEGLSYEELAQVLGISKGTVMSRLFHARRYMQRALRPYLGLAEGEGLASHSPKRSQGRAEPATGGARGDGPEQARDSGEAAVRGAAESEGIEA